MTGSEVAQQRPVHMIEQYGNEFAKVLPTHVRPEVFARLAVGALKRDPKLMDAAERNPNSLMHALMEAARLGLEPGTPEFYLTPRGGKNPGVLGITGYQGEIELIYRAGAVASVKAELVHERDRFEFSPDMPRPQHRVDWFRDRGPVLGAYAYAEMVGGGLSKVVLIGPQEIERAMAASPSAGASSSPWKTDFGAMVLKTAVHRLAKWVPTSSEYLRDRLRAAAVAGQSVDAEPPAPAAVLVAAELVDAELVDDGEPTDG